MFAIYLAVTLLGGCAGFILEKATGYLINKRVEQPVKYFFSRTNVNTFIWVAINALSWLLVVWLNGLKASSIEFMLIFSTSLILAAVDITIKKIPNELILLTLLIGATFNLIETQLASIKPSLIGFLVGLLMFLAPALLGKGAGMGDVKYAAVVGFCLGLYGFLTAVLIMTGVLICYTIYLLLTRKGNLKTKIALGPFMAIGFNAVLLLNLFNSHSLVFDLSFFLQSIKLN